MAMTRHPHNDAGKATTLLIVLSLALCVIASTEAQEKMVLPDDLACPATANLFPEKSRDPDFIRYVFPNNAIPRRVSIALVQPEGKEVPIRFSWIGAIRGWGECSGYFVVKGDGNPNCFFLDYQWTGIPGNIPCKEFNLRIPEDIGVKEIAFSSLPSEKPEVLCPMPELAQEITNAFVDCQLNPEDESKSLILIQLLEKATPKYDCRGGGSVPVPAWWLVDNQITDDWVHWLYRKALEKNTSALRVYVKFVDTSSGYVAEYMHDQFWVILHDLPFFILDNWAYIKEYKESILASRELQSPANNIEMINIYSDIARKEPRFKSACDEIISILNGKSQDVITHNL